MTNVEARTNDEIRMIKKDVTASLSRLFGIPSSFVIRLPRRLVAP
jgi:hypothetical protein